MASDTPTHPETPAVILPSAAGIVAKAGTEPLPLLLDLNRDGIRDAEQRWFWHGLASGLYALLGYAFPKATESLVVKAALPKLDAVIDEVTK